jgi:hypothetical protein
MRWFSLNSAVVIIDSHQELGVVVHIKVWSITLTPALHRHKDSSHSCPKFLNPKFRPSILQHDVPQHDHGHGRRLHRLGYTCSCATGGMPRLCIAIGLGRVFCKSAVEIQVINKR